MRWLRTQIGDKPAWAIVAAAMLAAIGVAIVQFAPKLFSEATRLVRGGDDLRFLVREKASTRPIDGAKIQILELSSLEPIPLGDGKRELITRAGVASVRTPLPRGEYSIQLEVVHNGQAYGRVEPLRHSGSFFHTIDFAPDHGWWLKARSEPPETISPSAARSAARDAVARATHRPNWMSIAIAEIGQNEVSGPDSNPRIQEYLQSIGLPTSDEVPWNGAFVAWVFQQAGLRAVEEGRARAWLNWGKSSELEFGCVAVLWRESPASWTGHVGFFLRDLGNEIEILGGNQANAVNVQRFNKGRLLSCRMPSERT